MMVEFSSANFMELSVQDVSDMLMEDIHSSGENVKGALLYGKDQDGGMFKLSVILEVVSDD